MCFFKRVLLKTAETTMRLVSTELYTVDGRNPANQLRLVAFPIIYKVLYIPGGAGFLNHQQYFSKPFVKLSPFLGIAYQGEEDVREPGKNAGATTVHTFYLPL